MKNFCIVLLMLVFSTTAKAALTDSVVIDSKNKKIQIGSFILAKDSAPSTIKKYFGTPSRIETSSSGVERTYAYDDMGISFAIDPSGKVIEAVMINYNWDGDKKAAKSAFKGKLTMDNYTITELTSSSDININTKVNNIMCVGDFMCMTPPGKSNIAILIGFKDKKITQIGFGLTN